jgi:LEA14-like dessication related protein
VTDSARAAARRRLLGACVALPGLAVLAACSTFPPPGLKPPKLSFAGLAVPAIGPSEIEFRLTVAADNPNDVELPLTNLQFELDLLGRPFATGGAREGAITLPRQGARLVPIVFTVPTSRLLDLLSAVRGGDAGRFEYRLRGSANWGDSPFKVPFEKSGDLEALQRLRKAFGRPAS